MELNWVLLAVVVGVYVAWKIVQTGRFRQCMQETAPVTDYQLTIIGDIRLREFIASGDNTVKELHLKNVTHLWSGMFAHLGALNDLRISGPVSEIPAGIFDNLTNLLTLKIKCTGLTELPTGVFDKLVYLRKLAINDSKIRFLPHDIFSTLRCIVNIDISGNKLEYIPDSIYLHDPEFVLLFGPWLAYRKDVIRHREIRLRLISDSNKSQYLNLYHLIDRNSKLDE